MAIVRDGVDERGVFALEEIRRHANGLAAMESVIDGLDAFTNSQWEFQTYGCAGPSEQRVGFLWNKSRATLSDVRTIWQFNDKATGDSTAFVDMHRPGF